MNWRFDSLSQVLLFHVLLMFACSMVSGHQEAVPHPFKAQTFPILCLREEICYELMDFTDQLMFMETKIINYFPVLINFPEMLCGFIFTHCPWVTQSQVWDWKQSNCLNLYQFEKKQVSEEKNKCLDLDHIRLCGSNKTIYNLSEIFEIHHYTSCCWYHEWMSFIFRISWM